MKRNGSYILREIAEVPYLLPFGQAAADRKRGIQINETGVYLWNLLEQERTKEELLRICAGHYGASPGELPLLEKDLEQFLWNLTAHGVLENSGLENSGLENPKPKNLEPENPLLANSDTGIREKNSENSENSDRKVLSSDSLTQYLKIGGLCLKLIGPPEAFPDSFHAFLAKEPAADSAVHQTVVLEMDSPGIYGNGKMLLRAPQLAVMESESHYFLLFPTGRQLREAYLAKDASRAVFYCTPPCTDILREELFHAIRLTYLYLAQKHRMAALHSASILYRDRAWLFSGPSGTGKSTHSGLWNRLLQAPLINGDLNLLSGFDGQAGKGRSACTACDSISEVPKAERPLPLIHGIPWCGTSGIWDTGTYPLGGIILLKQAGGNRIEELSPDKKRLLVMQRLISPAWTAALLDSNLQLVHELADHILICRLHCTMEDAAVAVMRERIDSYLEHDL